MKITYTGSPEELAPKQLAKLEGKLKKMVKPFERKGEKDAHIILSQVRHLHKVEITLNAFDHALSGAASDKDLALAMAAAIDKLEKQFAKMTTRWRDTHRHESIKALAPAPEQEAPVRAKKAPVGAAAAARKPMKVAQTKVYRVNHSEGRKPMSLEEAMLDMGASLDYYVYRDAKTGRICTLLRRNDGHLDLVES